MIDFSENYFLKYNQEIQSAHFGASKKQGSLQTGAFYYKNHENKIECVSFSFISDCLRHDTAAAWALLQPIFELIKNYVPHVETIHFQSDGPTKQYKNKSNFYLFNYFSNTLKLKSCTWNYSGAGHGKSAADAVGGSLKSLCDRAVMFGKDLICAKEMVDLLNESDCKIKVFLVLEIEIE